MNPNKYVYKFMEVKRKNSITFWALALILPIMIGLHFITENRQIKNKESQIKELASDIYLTVADLDIVVPTVALLEPTYAYASYSFPSWKNSNQKAIVEERIKFKKLSEKPETAPKVDRVKILISQYQYYGENVSSHKICPILKRSWAQYFCRGEYPELMKKLPEEFYIVNDKSLDLFAHHFTVGGEKMADQISRLNVKENFVDLWCDKHSKFCTAGTRTSPNTLAVWTVWSSEKLKKSSREMAELQGKAIRIFIRYAIGSYPDFEQMHKEMDE